jgi:hypothetical protein
MARCRGRRASGAHVAVVELPLKLKEKLRALGLAEQRVLGLSTLEIPEVCIEYCYDRRSPRQRAAG